MSVARVGVCAAVALLLFSAPACGRPPADGRARSGGTDAVIPSGLVFVFTGESNSGGAALNAHATPSELAPRASVQIMNLTSGDFEFENLDIGRNNLRDHDGFRGEYHLLHGFELHLSDAVEAGELPGVSQVFLVKTGQGGSTLREWRAGGAYWKKFQQRISAAKRQIREPTWVVWLSLGINDSGAGTPVATFKSELAAHVRRIQAELPGAVVVMTGFQSMDWMQPFDAALGEIAREGTNVFVVETSGADRRDAVHWSYAGFKAIGAKMVAVTREALARQASRFPTFEYHRIDGIGSQIGQTSLVDVDNDGDLDWIAGQADRTGADIWWWEYQSADRWVRHAIGKGNTDVGGAAFDVNRDGWIDFLSGSVLLLNSKAPKQTPFAAHPVGTIYSHDSEFADINGDGRMDALANSDQTGLYWYEIPDDPTRPWTSHLIASSTSHQIHGGADVVQSEADNPDGRVAWFENNGRGEWTRHLIKDKGGRQDFHALAVADFDRDGDLDVFSGGGPLSAPNTQTSFIWENTAGPTGRPTPDKWVEHIVIKKPVHEVEAGDVDGDGDIDLVAKPWTEGNEHFYLRNMR